MKKRLLVLMIILLVCVTLFSGCTTSEKPNDSQDSSKTENVENNQNVDETDNIPLPPQLPEV